MSKGSRPRPYSVPLEQVYATHETIFGVKPRREQYIPPPLTMDDEVDVDPDNPDKDVEK